MIRRWRLNLSRTVFNSNYIWWRFHWLIKCFKILRYLVYLNKANWSCWAINLFLITKSGIYRCIQAVFNKRPSYLFLYIHCINLFVWNKISLTWIESKGLKPKGYIQYKYIHLKIWKYINYFGWLLDNYGKTNFM
jgi:hypothetical protein